jgi:omega-6 fatty acid desaturase (delta-12 desaturase)
MTADRDVSGSDAEVRRAAAAFAQPSRSKGALQLLTSFGPFVAACVAMYLVYPISPWLTLALAVPTGALLLRVFIVQHDCGHGSFLPSRRANVIVGRICSLITMTPFANWCRQHGLHHADWNNLDRADGGVDIYSACLTVRQYLALSRWQRLRYRVPRHPLIANVAFPPLLFLLVYRVPFDTPPTWVRERRSVHLTNLSLVALFGTLTIIFGWQQVLLIHVPVIAVSSILGVWLFSLQHRFEESLWTPKAEWNYVDAALHGASWFRLPKVLHWLTGNIGYHHVHHLNPRVPNYSLARAHEAVQAMRPVKPLGLVRALASPRLTLWDEASGRLVRFRDARKAVP